MATPFEERCEGWNGTARSSPLPATGSSPALRANCRLVQAIPKRLARRDGPPASPFRPRAARGACECAWLRRCVNPCPPNPTPLARSLGVVYAVRHDHDNQRDDTGSEGFASPGEVCLRLLTSCGTGTASLRPASSLAAANRARLTSSGMAKLGADPQQISSNLSERLDERGANPMKCKENRNGWRPQGDSNPRFRRERPVS